MAKDHGDPVFISVLRIYSPISLNNCHRDYLAKCQGDIKGSPVERVSRNLGIQKKHPGSDKKGKSVFVPPF